LDCSVSAATAACFLYLSYLRTKHRRSPGMTYKKRNRIIHNSENMKGYDLVPRVSISLPPRAGRERPRVEKVPQLRTIQISKCEKNPST